jgi:hypothetical protein
MKRGIVVSDLIERPFRMFLASSHICPSMLRERGEFSTLLAFSRTMGSVTVVNISWKGETGTLYVVCRVCVSHLTDLWSVLT